MRISKTRVRGIAPAAVVLGILTACSDGVLNSGSGAQPPASEKDDTDSAREPNDTETGVRLTPEDTDVVESDDTSTGMRCGGGTLYEGICWYLSGSNQSCLELCELNGGYHPDTPRYIGSRDQGGDFDACYDILVALGRSGTLFNGRRDDGLGLGCHRWDETDYWWLYEPDFDPTHKTYSARLVCGCYGI